MVETYRVLVDYNKCKNRNKIVGHSYNKLNIKTWRLPNGCSQLNYLTGTGFEFSGVLEHGI